MESQSAMPPPSTSIPTEMAGLASRYLLNGTLLGRIIYDNRPAIIYLGTVFILFTITPAPAPSHHRPSIQKQREKTSARYIFYLLLKEETGQRGKTEKERKHHGKKYKKGAGKNLQLEGNRI